MQEYLLQLQNEKWHYFIFGGIFNASTSKFHTLKNELFSCFEFLNETKLILLIKV